MTPPWETVAGYLLVYGALAVLAALGWWALIHGSETAANEHDRRMARVRASYPPFVPPPTNVTALPPRRDVVRVPHSRSR